MNDNATLASQKGKIPSSQTIIKTAALALLVSSASVAIDAARTPAHAQDGGVTWLDTIAVVGTRTATSVQDNPASVTVVDEEELEKKAPESIAEMLRDVPGVQVVDSSAPGMKRLSIRGESSRRVTILVNGQEITDHSTFGTPILVDPANVERIEVVRGPASVLHGAKAIGGVINIITKKGADKPVQVELGGTYYSGTDGWQGWGAVSGTVDNFDYRFSGSLDDHSDRKVPAGQYTPTGRLDGTSFNSDNISAHLGYTFGEAGNHYIALKAEQHRLSTESWTDPAVLTGLLPGATSGTTHFKIDLPQRDLRKVGISYDGKDLGPVVTNVHFDAYYQTVDRLFTNEAAEYFGTIARITSDDVNINYGGTFQVDFNFHPDHKTIFGASYLHDKLEARKVTNPGPGLNLYSNDDAYINTASAFAQNEWNFSENVNIIGGVRYYNTETVHEYAASNGTPFNPTISPIATKPGASDGAFVKSLGVTYTGLESTTLRALYSEGYITPTLLQLFTDTRPAGQQLWANPNLKPETSRNFEIGARYNSGSLLVDAAAFYTEADNYIAVLSCTAPGITCPVAPPGTPSVRTMHVNADKAQTYGLELTAEYAIPDTAFTPYVAGAWMRRNLQFNTFSTYHSDTPALAGRLGVRWEGEVASHNAWADLYVRAATETKLEESPGTIKRLPGYGTLNFAVGGSFGGEDDDRFRYAISFNNILDKEYRSSFSEIPGVGRSVEASLRMKF